ncbi:MAG: 23S rRNA (pseudouridine(1915)-N(3))-methyltransferase RlmH [Pseudomonadota bacterium]
MRLTIVAVGRAKGAEAALVDDYLARATRTGRALGIGPAALAEVDERKGGDPGREAHLIEARIGRGARCIPLDERGEMLTSPAFADRLAMARDQGCREVAFLIGGADGLAPHLREGAVAFGRMVWPHMLARVMLAEQIYRATTILAGGPYHRV